MRERRVDVGAGDVAEGIDDDGDDKARDQAGADGAERAAHPGVHHHRAGGEEDQRVGADELARSSACRSSGRSARRAGAESAPRPRGLIGPGYARAASAPLRCRAAFASAYASRIGPAVHDAAGRPLPYPAPRTAGGGGARAWSRQCEREVRGFHAFLRDWLAGAVPRTAETFARFSGAMDARARGGEPARHGDPDARRW